MQAVSNEGGFAEGARRVRLDLIEQYEAKRQRVEQRQDTEIDLSHVHGLVGGKLDEHFVVFSMDPGDNPVGDAPAVGFGRVLSPIQFTKSMAAWVGAEYASEVRKVPISIVGAVKACADIDLIWWMWIFNGELWIWKSVDY